MGLTASLRWSGHYFFPDSQTMANIEFIFLKKLSQYMKYIIDKMNSKDSNYNYLICQGEHSYMFSGRVGEDWGHNYQEFPIEIGKVR